MEDPPKRLRVTARASAEPNFPIDANDLTIGFRCVKDAGRGGEMARKSVTDVKQEDPKKN